MNDNDATAQAKKWAEEFFRIHPVLDIGDHDNNLRIAALGWLSGCSAGIVMAIAMAQEIMA